MSATFGGKTVRFSLQPAKRTAGLRRVVKTLNGKRVEIGAVTDNQGRTYSGGSLPSGRFVTRRGPAAK